MTMYFKKGSLGHLAKKAFHEAALTISIPMLRVGHVVRDSYAANPLMPPLTPSDPAFPYDNEQRIEDFRIERIALGAAAGAVSLVQEMYARNNIPSHDTPDLGVKGFFSTLAFDAITHMPILSSHAPALNEVLTHSTTAKIAFSLAAAFVPIAYLTPNVYGTYLSLRYGIPQAVKKIGDIKVYTPKP